MKTTEHAERIVFAIALVGLAFGAQGGPGWLAPSGRAIVAIHLDHTAGSPLYDVLAGGFARLPLGEPGFRLGLLAAVLGAITLTGLVAAARALVKDPIPGAIAALLVILAPATRTAMGAAQPAMLAAAGTIWALVFALDHQRVAGRRAALLAFAACAVAIGAAPWLGVGITIVVLVWLWRTGLDRALVAPALAAIGASIAILWIGALGTLPPLDPDLGATVAASGAGATALVVGAGLLGVGFGAATGLRGARPLALVVVLAATDAIVVDHDGVVLVCVLALGIVILLRALAKALPTWRGDVIALVAGVPLVGAAALLGARLDLDDPGAAPARLAADLVDELPAGPGLELATRAPGWYAIEHEQQIAGSRPDLALALPAQITDVTVATALRDRQRVIGADVAAFGRLDPLRATPAGRGFQLVGERVATVAAPPTRARYASALGADEALRVDLARATYEAANGRLEVAARVVGLAGPDARFGAGDLAVLAATIPTRARPPLFAYAPEGAAADDVALFGDDLAWVASLPEVALPPQASLARRLHARWRDRLVRHLDPTTDPAIEAMGPAAVRATAELGRALVKEYTGRE